MSGGKSCNMVTMICEKSLAISVTLTFFHCLNNHTNKNVDSAIAME